MKTLAGEAVISQLEHVTPKVVGNKGRHLAISLSLQMHDNTLNYQHH